VSPFISTESRNFAVGVKNQIFVGQRNASANVPALTWFKVKIWPFKKFFGIESLHRVVV
jgi:hypothetical protein